MFDRVRNDDVGQVQVVKITSRDSPMPSSDFLKISGGHFHDCGIHDVDIICWIMGEVPDTVFCLAHVFHSHIAEMDDVDTVGVIMKFPSGAIGQIDQSREAVYGYDHRIILDLVECLPATTKTRWPQPIFIPREAPNFLSNFLFRNDIPKLSI